MSEGTIKIEEQKGVTVATFVNVVMLDETSIKEPGDALEELIKSSEKINLVIDFSKIEFVSSAVLGRLVKIRKIVKTRGSKLALCGMAKDLKQIFKVTKLDKAFKIHDTREKALKSFRSFFG